MGGVLSMCAAVCDGGLWWACFAVGWLVGDAMLFGDRVSGGVYGDVAGCAGTMG